MGIQKFVAKTLYGLENVLASELKEPLSNRCRAWKPCCYFLQATKSLLYRINYCSRTAISVLMPVASFSIGSREDLYKSSKALAWSKYMSASMTFSIVPVVNSKLF